MTRAALLCTAALLLFGCPGQDAGSGATADAKGNTETKPDAKGKTDTKSKVDTKTETDAKSKTDPDTEAGAKTKTDAKPKGPPKADPAEIAKARTLYLKRLNEGRRLTKAGEFTEAIAMYLEALEVDPSDVALLGELGWASFKGGDLPGARHATTHGLRFARTDKQRGMLTYNLGRIAEAEGNPTRAAELYVESLKYRDNATVKKRLESLSSPAPTPAPAPVGLTVVAEALPSLDQVCEKVKEGYCDDWTVYEDDECLCEPELLVADGGDWAGILTLSAGMAADLYFPVLKTPAGYTVVDSFLDNYNPGVFGIYGEVEITSNELDPELLGAGKPGWHIAYRKDRMDRDMGINEIEDEHWVGHVFCAREGDRARCSVPVLVDYHYSREVEFPGEDEPGVTHEDLPISLEYSDTISWSGGTLTIKKGKRKGMKGLDPDLTPGTSLPAKDHVLRERIGL